MYPENYDFSNGLNNWTAHNGFTMYWRNNEIIGWENNEPVYGDATDKGYLINYKNRSLPPTLPWFGTGGGLDLTDSFEEWEYAETIIPVSSIQEGDSANIEINFNVSQVYFNSPMKYLILAKKGSEVLALDPSGSFFKI